jgi:hypothetical protein
MSGGVSSGIRLGFPELRDASNIFQTRSYIASASFHLFSASIFSFSAQYTSPTRSYGTKSGFGTLEIEITGEEVGTGRFMKGLLIGKAPRMSERQVLQGDPEQVIRIGYQLSLSCGIPLRESSWNGNIAK